MLMDGRLFLPQTFMCKQVFIYVLDVGDKQLILDGTYCMPLILTTVIATDLCVRGMGWDHMCALQFGILPWHSAEILICFSMVSCLVGWMEVKSMSDAVVTHQFHYDESRDPWARRSSIFQHFFYRLRSISTIIKITNLRVNWTPTNHLTFTVLTPSDVSILTKLWNNISMHYLHNNAMWILGYYHVFREATFYFLCDFTWPDTMFTFKISRIQMQFI